jgi:putative transposase
VISIAGKKHWLWRAVDQLGAVLNILVQRHRNAKAPKRLLRKLLKKQSMAPRMMITDKIAGYAQGDRSDAGPAPRALPRLGYRLTKLRDH